MNTNSFTSEIWRTIRKDTYRARWMLLFFVVVCASFLLMNYVSLEPVLQFTCVEGCPGKNGSAIFSLLVLMLVCVCVLPALLVQYDSPTRLDAFWRFQPSRSSSVAIGKLLFALPVIPLVLSICQAISIALIEVPIVESWYAVALTMYWMASLTMFSMLVAALVPDIRVFIFAMIGFVVLRIAIVSSYLLGDWLTSIFVAVPGLRADVWFVLAPALLVWSYTSRARRLRTKRWLLCSGICVLAIGWDTGDLAGIRFLNRTNEVANSSLPIAHFSAQMSQTGAMIRIAAAAPPKGSRFVFVHTLPTLQFYDGVVRLAANTGTDNPVLSPGSALDDSLAGTSGGVFASFPMELDGESIAKLRSGPAHLLLNGFLVEQRDTLIGELAAATGYSLQRGADRLTVRTVSYDTMPIFLGVEQLHIGAAPLFATVGRQYQHYPKNAEPTSGVPYTLRLADSEFEYFVANNEGRDTLQLGARREGGSSFPLVIPVSSASRPFIRLSPQEPHLQALRETWLTPKTRILVRQWKYKSYKPVHGVLLLPQQLRPKN